MVEVRPVAVLLCPETPPLPWSPLKHPPPVITTLTTYVNCCVLAPAHFFHISCDITICTFPRASIIYCTIIPILEFTYVDKHICDIFLGLAALVVWQPTTFNVLSFR